MNTARGKSFFCLVPGDGVTFFSESSDKHSQPSLGRDEKEKEKEEEKEKERGTEQGHLLRRQVRSGHRRDRKLLFEYNM